ncbi:MAG: imidazolonepropionase [Bacteroidales bacterium]
MDILIKNIKSVLNTVGPGIPRVSGGNMAKMLSVENGYIAIENGLISAVGDMNSCPVHGQNTIVIDATGKMALPTFCDSHTHIVFAGSRENEFKDKIQGLSYEEIARRGGGILNSAKLLHDTSEDELYEQSVKRVNEIISLGTGAVEIKSGYGLNTADELKMLRVIRRIRNTSPLLIKATFLGAHAIPLDYKNKRQDYISIIINEMIPAVASEELADYIDVFCDKGFFTVDETEQILMAGIKHGLLPKLHANELDYSGGVQTGVKYNAVSVDHLECTGQEEIKALLNSDTMPVLLPGSAFFLGLPNPPARDMINAGLPLALASDYNPGSSPSGNMKLVMSLACIRLKLLPEEALYASTINGAYAMGISETHGSITPGKSASIIITSPVPSPAFLPYSFGSDLVEKVILDGKIVVDKAR